MNFKDKTIVITGASSGIGYALAYEFASRGARIVMGAGRKTSSAPSPKIWLPEGRKPSTNRRTSRARRIAAGWSKRRSRASAGSTC